MHRDADRMIKGLIAVKAGITEGIAAPDQCGEQQHCELAEGMFEQCGHG